MNDDGSRSLGFKLISVSVALTALAALIVGVMVTKLSEDATKERLFGAAETLAATAREAIAAKASDPPTLARYLMAAKFRQGGTVWVIDKDGALLVNPETGTSGAKADKFMARSIRLMAVRKPLGAAKSEGNELPLKELSGKYEAGYGQITDENEAKRVAAFVSLPDAGWVVGLDEPVSDADNLTSSVKRYVLLTSFILGLAVILSTVVSISFIIKPYYRQQLEMARKVEKANNNLKRLHDLSIGMQKHLDLDDRMRDILSAAREVVGMDRIFIFLPDAEAGLLCCQGAVGNRDEAPKDICVPIGPDGGVLYRAYSTREVLTADSLRLPPPYSEIKALRSRESVALPLIVENECVGVVLADNQLSKLPITREKIEGMELFLNQAAVAIQNANLYAKLRKYADKLEITDHLTGAFNIDHFKELIGAGITKARETATPLALGVVNVANFAEYNQLTGHRSGDEVLMAVARIVTGEAGAEGVVGRCFGSTFGVLLSGDRALKSEQVFAAIDRDFHGMEFVGQSSLAAAQLLLGWGVLPYDPKRSGTVEEYLAKVIELSRQSAA